MTRTSRYELSGESIAEFAGGRLVSGAGFYAAAGGSIDSRTIRGGQIFFALDGENVKGADYVEAACERQAAGIVVSARDMANPAVMRCVEGGRCFVVVVDDAKEALIRSASAWREILSPLVIAITGSLGKTSVKNLIAAATGAVKNVHATMGNLNNRLGVSLTCLGLRPSHEVLVAEMGMNASGEISELCSIAPPDVAVVTTVAPVHLEGLKTLENVAAAKSEIIDALGPGKVAVLNADEPLVMAMGRKAAEKGARVISFGRSEDADVRLVGAEMDSDGRVTAFLLYRWEAYTVSLLLAGLHNAMNAAAALAAAVAVGIDPVVACDAMSTVTPAAHRMELSDVGTVRLIDDCYNASPRSVEAALDALVALSGQRRRFAILGDLLEMGEATELVHRDMGTAVQVRGVNCLIAVGKNSSVVASAAIEAGMSRTDVYEAPDSLAAASLAREILKPRDVVLVKASHSVGLDLVVEAIKARFGSGSMEAGN